MLFKAVVAISLVVLAASCVSEKLTPNNGQTGTPSVNLVQGSDKSDNVTALPIYGKWSFDVASFNVDEQPNITLILTYSAGKMSVDAICKILGSTKTTHVEVGAKVSTDKIETLGEIFLEKDGCRASIVQGIMKYKVEGDKLILSYADSRREEIHTLTRVK